MITRPEREHVGIVVQPGQPRRRDIVAQRGANALVAVRGDRDADPGAANDHTASGTAIGQAARQRVRHVWIVDAVQRVRPEIERLPAGSLEAADQRLFQVEAGVIGGEGDGRSLHGFTGEIMAERVSYHISAGAAISTPTYRACAWIHPDFSGAPMISHGSAEINILELRSISRSGLTLTRIQPSSIQQLLVFDRHLK